MIDTGRKIYIFVLGVLVFLMFFGIFGANINIGHDMSGSTQCFGTQCGPIEHITVHVYNIPDTVSVSPDFYAYGSLLFNQSRYKFEYVKNIYHPPKAV